MEQEFTDLSTLVVGETYWVINGHWTFTVKEKWKKGMFNPEEGFLI